MNKDCVVFTSCGDNTSCYDLWTSSDRRYDIVSVYYGDDDSKFETYKSKFDSVIRRKGSKFQNFFYLFRETSLLDNYKYYFVLDDDIVISTSEINEMFEFSKYHEDILICQPSFKEGSKISHDITRQNSNTAYRYTNFVEVNTPLFKRVSIDRLNTVYENSLIGWGVDFLYIWINNKKSVIVDSSCRSFAVVDYITCINPKDEDKLSKKRELNLLDLNSNGEKVFHARDREKLWLSFAKKNNIPGSYEVKNLKYVPLSDLGENSKTNN